MGRFSGKVCVVTGGAQGIGRGICRQYAREGATVLVADIVTDKGKEVAESLEELGGMGLFVHTDVGRKEAVANMVATAHDTFGRIDVLVNAAISLSPHTDFQDKTRQMCNFVLHVGIYGTLWGMQAVFPIMRAQGGGRIINFESLARTNGQWYTLDYNATKAAIAALTKSAAAEWAQYGILCNAIAPAAASMGFDKMIIDQPELLDFCASLPLGRVGDPEDDIAPVAVFLASDDAKYVTGQTIHVDGGISLSRAEMFRLTPPERITEWLGLPFNVQG